MNVTNPGSVGQPSKFHDDTPSLFTYTDDRPVFMDAYQSFDRMWRLLVLPLAYAEKSVFDMLALLGKQHRLSLQPGGHQTAFQTQAYAQMLYIVSSIAKNSPQEAVLAAISTLFAYERLASAATATDPPDRFIVHSSAIKSLIAQPGVKPDVLSYFAGPAMFSASMRSFFTNRDRSLSSISSMPAIPDDFTDLCAARDSFFEILRLHEDNDQIRRYMARWSVVMRRYFENCKENDWNDAKKAFIMLTEFEYLRAIFEASTKG